jgi:hypothetical protein
MKIFVSAALAAAQTAAVAQPAFAAEIQREATAATGTFGGLRLRVPLDGRRNERAPRLGLAFAPTVHTMGEDGAARLRIGEGLEFGFSGRRASPSLSIAGRRLGAAQDEDGNRDDDEGGIDTGEGILIAAGVVVLALAAGTIWFVNEMNESSD